MFAKAQPNAIAIKAHDAAIDHKEPTPIIPSMTMTVEAMMKELPVSRKTAYELVKQKGFPAFRIGNRILVNREGLQRWIDQQCQEQAA